MKINLKFRKSNKTDIGKEIGKAIVFPEAREFDFWPLATKLQMEHTDRCILCSRKLGKKHSWVRVVAGGGKLLHNDDNWIIDNLQINTMSDVGCWGIGSECKNKIPAEFVRKELT